MVGSFLGLFGALQTLLLGSISGAVIGYSYIKFTGRDPNSYELPFGTFLAAAALVAAVVGLLPM
jgi:leader peptidase (prepilin peptidase)/N-methyltransferase